jgi:hypothetical protein
VRIWFRYVLQLLSQYLESESLTPFSQRRALERPSWTLDPNASYLIVGGLGGLGRAILLWLAERGAKHLIVPSRSGPSSAAATSVVSQLSSLGVNIVTPTCDAASADELSQVLEECAEKMPPIKGCINWPTASPMRRSSRMTGPSPPGSRERSKP